MYYEFVALDPAGVQPSPRPRSWITEGPLHGRDRGKDGDRDEQGMGAPQIGNLDHSQTAT